VSSKKTALDVLFPRVRAELLRLLFVEPAQQRYVRELMNMSGLALHTIQDELRKLTAVGLIVTWSNGYHRFYRANQDHPLFGSLFHIVRGSAKLPLPNKECFVNLTVGARQNSEPDNRQCRYRKIGRGNGTYSRVGGKHDGFKPSCLGPAKRKNCGHLFRARRAAK